MHRAIHPLLMHRAIHPLLIALFLAISACAPQVAKPPVAVALSYPYANFARNGLPGHRALAERVRPAYARLTIYEKGDGPPPVDISGRTIVVASAILLNRRGYAVTAAHIAKDIGYGARLRTVDGRDHEAQILHIAPGRELALLRITSSPTPAPARYKTAPPPRRGEPIIAIGSPDLTSGVVSVGRVRKPRRDTRLSYGRYGFERGMEFKIEVESGNSGGPAFDARGNLVGMIASYLLGDTTKTPYASPAIAFAVPAADIEAYLAEQIR